MLSFHNSANKQNNGFHLLGTEKSSGYTVLISNNKSLISQNSSLLGNSLAGIDVCSFYSGPSDSAIIAFGESCGSVASADYGSGSVSGYSGGSESCGSIASSGASFSCV